MTSGSAKSADSISRSTSFTISGVSRTTIRLSRSSVNKSFGFAMVRTIFATCPTVLLLR